MPGLVVAISLLLSVIWLSPALAVDFASLGQIKADALRVPGAMDLDVAGNLYVADERGGQVHKFSPYGTLLQSYDLGASGGGLAIAPDGSRLYVSMGQSVAVVDAATASVQGVLAGGAVDGPEFGVAGQIDLDASGNVFVVDAATMQVKAYNSGGQFQGAFGEVGTAVGQFRQIGGMAVNPAGQVVVADASAMNGNVQVFTLNGDLSVASVVAYAKSNSLNFGTPVMNTPRGMDFDAQGRGYILEFQGSQVRVVDAGFSFLGAYVQAGYDVGQLNNVKDVVFDDVNSRLFVGCDPGRIEILGVDGGSNPDHLNRAPSAPSAQSPVAGSVVGSLSPTLVINNATDEDGDALTYQVVVTGADGFAHQMDVPADAGETTTVVVDRELVENAAYSWTVQASDGELLSAVSDPANFVVNATDEAPSQPQLPTLLDGAPVDGSVVLSWLESSDPDPNEGLVGYSVELSLDASFAEGGRVAVEELSGVSLSLDSFAAYADLVDGTSYFWRVTAVDGAGNESVPSVVDSFVYDTSVLSVAANMPGARVSFHGNHGYAGQYAGVAPLEIRDFEPGTLSVVVERAGFEPYVAQVVLGEAQNVEVYARLVPSMDVKNLNIARNSINGRSGLRVNGRAVPFLVDFDNDGDLDMLTADDQGQIELFANMDAAGRNRLYFDQGVPLAPAGIAPFVVDWNNDGRKDLVVGQSDGMVKLFANVGLEEAPVFDEGVELLALPVGLDAAPAVADWNGDGAKDLLVGNAAGQVLLFVNQSGSDAAPAFADFGQEELKLTGAVVPFPVDWDADGEKELLVTNAGVVTVFKKVDGQYQAQVQFSDRRADFFAAFPLDVDGSGKQLVVGQEDGELVYLSGMSENPVASFLLALQDKVEQVRALVSEEASSLLPEVATIGMLIGDGDYVGATLAARTLAAALPVGAARVATLELAELCE